MTASLRDLKRMERRASRRLDRVGIQSPYWPHLLHLYCARYWALDERLNGPMEPWEGEVDDDCPF